MGKLQCLCLSLFFGLSVFVYAQQTAAPAGAAAHSELAPLPMPENSEGRVKLDVVVTDKSGKPVSGLAANDFSLLDNKKSGKILSLHDYSGAVQAAEVILAIDTVNQPLAQITREREGIGKFLRQNGGHLAYPVSILLVTEKGVDAVCVHCTDGNALAAQVDQLDIKLQPFIAYAALVHFQISLDIFSAISHAGANIPGKKLLVWVGPGWPTIDSLDPHFAPSSKVQQQYFDRIVQFSTLLREKRITLYSVSLGSYGLGSVYYESYLKGVRFPGDALAPHLALKVLATQSGGSVLGPDNDLADQINSCIQDASAFYTLSFDPQHTNKPNEYHDLKVLVDKPGLKVRTSTGYYNQAQP